MKQQLVPGDLYSLFIQPRDGYVIADLYQLGTTNKILHQQYKSEATAIAACRRRIKAAACSQHILLHREPWIGRVERIGWR